MHGYPPVLKTAPATTPVSVADLRGYSGIGDDVDDAVITAMIEAATATIDGWSGILGRAIVSQTWTQDFDRFSREIILALPALSVSSVEWKAADGTTVTNVSSDDYDLEHLAGGSAVVFPTAFTLPSGLYGRRAVTVEFVAGYGVNAADVPAPIRQAIKMMVADMHRLGSADGVMRNESVEGVGSTSWSSPDLVAESTRKLIDRMLSPYRIFSI
ncbi:hypothetical protein [Notoacmeibacter sp. MSK16QG-6]|uniref:head-tail connector protein n=1 Tax=Notoacmeibacter sp. MSK16QG-6 TaxID=2957982 RepID=UPI00209FD43B|nr:hypothetical protein [Notoacmeibacter sp. MSK16QG-6]MCP1200059.1 hypothetical protein [Notoacmeibacter sp. MSK16QG-6]